MNSIDTSPHSAVTSVQIPALAEWLMAAEIVAASALSATGVQLSAAFGALLLPTLPDGLYHFGVCRLRSTKPYDPGLIRLLHCTLRMDAAG
jgi:hypothetical protein